MLIKEFNDKYHFRFPDSCIHCKYYGRWDDKNVMLYSTCTNPIRTEGPVDYTYVVPNGICDLYERMKDDN
jgi:hypothetical protein